jgi:hypothetical protein
VSNNPIANVDLDLLHVPLQLHFHLLITHGGGIILSFFSSSLGIFFLLMDSVSVELEEPIEREVPARHMCSRFQNGLKVTPKVIHHINRAMVESPNSAFVPITPAILMFT